MARCCFYSHICREISRDKTNATQILEEIVPKWNIANSGVSLVIVLTARDATDLQHDLVNAEYTTEIVTVKMNPQPPDADKTYINILILVL